MCPPSGRDDLGQLVLCEACEQRFSKLGEAPVIQLLSRGDSFPLFEQMNLAQNIGRSGDATAFSGVDLGIDTTAMAYFALSLPSSRQRMATSASMFAILKSSSNSLLRFLDSAEVKRLDLQPESPKSIETASICRKNVPSSGISTFPSPQ
jgi:hypothetical protein